MFGVILGLLAKIVNWFFGGESELHSGERLGTAETVASGATKELSDVQKANDATLASERESTGSGMYDPDPFERKD